MASHRISLVVFMVSAFCLPLAYLLPSPPGIDHEAKKVHLEHLQRLTRFPCKTPQPRIIPITQLFKASEILEKAHFPDATVLHRCDFGAGCCTHGGFCAPLRQQSVRLPFKVTYFQDVGPHKRGSWRMEFHHFLNHTECGCMTTAQPSQHLDAHDC